MRERHSIWLLFIIAVLILSFKTIYFHQLTFGLFPQCASGMALTICKFYVAKLLPSILISSILLFVPNKIWITICMLLADFLCLANIIYFKSYDLFLTIDSISLLGNMDGAWTSLEAYLDVRLLLFPLSTAIWIMLSYLIKLQSNRNPKIGGVLVVFLFILGYTNNILIYDYTDVCGVTKFSNNATNTPFTFKKYCRLPFMGIAMHRMDGRTYVYEQSILSYLPSEILRFVREIGNDVELTEKDNYAVKQLINNSLTENLPPPSTSVIIILVESLESWVINQKVDGVEITPFLNSLVSQQHVLYCDKIKSQTLAGNSGDGQMIVNTGLLPIKKGVACMQFYSNVYPNIASMYPSSFTINPWPHIWNQTAMSKRYGYKQLHEPKPNENWQDRDVLDRSTQLINKADTNFCAMNITISMHSPFDRISNPLPLSNNTPDLLRKYIECVNYTDKCIEYFLCTQLSDSIRNNSTIVITSDHTIFKPAVLKDFVEYAIGQNLSFANGNNYCPLIIYSPKINENIYVSEVCYQMDIYPTIINIIEKQDYYWKGFGVNLLDSTAHTNRFITEKEAYELSDKLIRSNYFKNYE